MVEILLMLKLLFTQGSEVEGQCCGASPGSEPSLFFSNNLFSLEFEPVHDDSQHDFSWMRLIVLLFWHSCLLPFLGIITLSD